MPNRREFLEGLAVATGAVVLVPVVTSCKKEKEVGGETPAADPQKKNPPEDKPLRDEPPGLGHAELVIPIEKPEGWDPIAFNRARGNRGAIPESYWKDINGPDGENKHLGKHLPYVPKLEAKLVPEGFLAIMWGDESKGHAKHPNAPKNESNQNQGHWYNWIRIRKAAEGEFEEAQSEYPAWPGEGDDSKGYAVFGGGDITADDGKNTVYLAGKPADITSGDTIRIHAHCLTHGEYIDFLTIA